MGYVNQSVGFGIDGSHYDTQGGFNQALFQFLLEGRLKLSPDLRLFGSVMANADWAYPVLSDNDNWIDKQFDQSRHSLGIFSRRDDILKEFHLTWTPGDFYFRIGKQIVVWGETDGFRVMDQINPLDSRRGITDVEFESTIIPIWLVTSAYYFHPQLSWMSDLGIELVFNPNPLFRGNEEIFPGNDKSGIWTPRIDIPLGGPKFLHLDYMHLGSLDLDWHKPGSFDTDGFEYGLRLRSVIKDAIVTLNAFYGRNNVYMAQAKRMPPSFEISDYDGRMIMHLPLDGYYPIQRFVGFTFTRDFEKLYVNALGGVAPVLRIEAFFSHNDTFETPNNASLIQRDEFRMAIGVDWKVKVPLLNPSRYFTVSPQFYDRKVLKYPHFQLTQGGGAKVYDNNYMTSLMVKTQYFHDKIVPMVFWLRDMTQKANMFKIQTTYDRSDEWHYTVGVILLNGEQSNNGFEAFHNKDQVFFTISYKF